MDLHEEAERMVRTALGIEWKYTESAARRVAEYAAVRLAEVERERDAARADLSNALQRSCDNLERAVAAEDELDEARARVAAAYEEAAKIAFTAATSQASAQHRKTIAAAVRALSRPEETDALAERDARIREEAFRQGFNAGVTAGRNLQEIEDEPPAAIREDKT